MLVLLGSDSNRAVSQILSRAWLLCFKLVNWDYKTLTKTRKFKTDMNQAQRTRLDVFFCETRPNFTTFDDFGLDQTDLLVTKVKGLPAPVPVQLQDSDDVPDGSEDG